MTCPSPLHHQQEQGNRTRRRKYLLIRRADLQARNNGARRPRSDEQPRKSSSSSGSSIATAIASSQRNPTPESPIFKDPHHEIPGRRHQAAKNRCSEKVPAAEMQRGITEPLPSPLLPPPFSSSMETARVIVPGAQFRSTDGLRALSSVLDIAILLLAVSPRPMRAFPPRAGALVRHRQWPEVDHNEPSPSQPLPGRPLDGGQGSPRPAATSSQEEEAAGKVDEEMGFFFIPWRSNWTTQLGFPLILRRLRPVHAGVLWFAVMSERGEIRW